MCAIGKFVLGRFIMRKITAIFFVILFLSGCFASNELSGKEYAMIHNGEQFYPIYLGFKNNDSFYVKSINDIKGVYNVDGEKLTMTVTENTKLTPDIQFAAIENDFVNALVRMKGFNVSADGLQLMTIDNRTFDFRYVGDAR